MSMLVIDRFEGKYAVCEDQKTGKMVNILKEKLPAEAEEGFCIEEADGSLKINMQKTYELKKEIEELTKNLWK